MPIALRKYAGPIEMPAGVSREVVRASRLGFQYCAVKQTPAETTGIVGIADAGTNELLVRVTAIDPAADADGLAGALLALPEFMAILLAERGRHDYRIARLPLNEVGGMQAGRGFMLLMAKGSLWQPDRPSGAPCGVLFGDVQQTLPLAMRMAACREVTALLCPSIDAVDGWLAGQLRRGGTQG